MKGEMQNLQEQHFKVSNNEYQTSIFIACPQAWCTFLDCCTLS